MHELRGLGEVLAVGLSTAQRGEKSEEADTDRQPEGGPVVAEFVLADPREETAVPEVVQDHPEYGLDDRSAEENPEVEHSEGGGCDTGRDELLHVGERDDDLAAAQANQHVQQQT